MVLALAMRQKANLVWHPATFYSWVSGRSPDSQSAYELRSAIYSNYSPSHGLRSGCQRLTGLTE